MLFCNYDWLEKCFDASKVVGKKAWKLSPKNRIFKQWTIEEENWKKLKAESCIDGAFGGGPTFALSIEERETFAWSIEDAESSACPSGGVLNPLRTS